MKTCSGCGLTKSLQEFGNHSTTRDGLNPKCRTCVSIYNKQYREANVDHIRGNDTRLAAEQSSMRAKRTRQWIKDNPERKRQNDKTYYQRLKDEGRLDEYYGNIDYEQVRLRSARWKKENPGKLNAQLAKRRADLLNATPMWAEFDLIIEVYKKARMLTEQTGINYEVDHIIPLNSKVVCGLHCIDNLQILTHEENNRKKCKLLEGM